MIRLALLFVALATGAVEPEKCAGGYPQLLPRYGDLFSLADVTGPLRGDVNQPFYQAKAVEAAVPDQPPLVFRVGRRQANDDWLLTLSQGNREVGSIKFLPSADGKKIFIAESHTGQDFLRRGAYDALTRVLFSLYPECTEASSRLAWTNFRRVAEGLAGREVANVAEQEKIIAKAGKAPLLEAIRLSPRGITMKNAGFEPDPESVRFTSTDQSHDYTPLLTVRWLKR